MQRVATAVALVTALSLVGTLRPWLFTRHATSQTAEDVYYLPADNRVLRTLTLGYSEAAADLLWMRALLYYADHLTSRSEATHAMTYAEALVTLDPDFAEVYRWAGLLPFYLSVETPPAVRRQGVDFLVRGAARLPDHGELVWDAAATLLYEYLPTFEGSPEERQRLQRVAADLSEQAVRLGAGPPWLALNNATLLGRLGETERAIRFLEQRMSVTDNPRERTDYMVRIQHLRGGAEAALLEAELRRLETSRVSQFPYLTPDEYTVFGARAFRVEQAP